MGASLSSTIPPCSPLECLLENLKSLQLMPHLRVLKLIHLCNKVWIQYPLDNGSKWPPNGTLDPIILRDLHTYRQQSIKWKEVLYAQAFTYLCSNPSLCSTCSQTQLPLAIKLPPDDATNLNPANKLPPFHCRLVSMPLNT